MNSYFIQNKAELEADLSFNLDQLLSKIQKIKEEYQHDSVSSQLSSTYQNQNSLNSLKLLRKNSDNMYFYRVQKIPTFSKNCSQNAQLVKKKKHRKLAIKSSKSLNLSFPTTSLEEIITKSTQEIDFDSSILIGATQKNIQMNSVKNLKIGDFQMGKCLGSGKFGDVYLCKHKLTSSVYALKKIFKSTIKQCNMVQQLAQQLKIHTQLDHPNIIKLYTYFDDQYHIFLLMEYCEGGNLMSKLNSSQSQVSQIINEVLEAVSFLHKRKIIHRDIKPQNIMLCFNNTIKLCDFGWSCFLNDDMKTTFCGTLDYLSPQMKDKGSYSCSVDLWSIGILTYQLLHGEPPFKDELSNWKAKGSQRNLHWNWEIKYPPYFSTLAQSFMRSILKENPQQRVSLNACKNHRFITNYKYKIKYQIQIQDTNILQ